MRVRQALQITVDFCRDYRDKSYVKWAAGAVGVILILLLDVWLLGTVAAWLLGMMKWLAGISIIATPTVKAAGQHAFDSVSYYWQHPMSTAWAWLTKPMLAAPAVRNIWLLLNGLLLLAVLAGWRNLKRKWNDSNSGNRDIEKVKFRKINFDINRYIENTTADQIFLALDDEKRPVTVPVRSLVEHMHILGGSGTGKTSLAVLPVCVQAIRRGLPVICIDFKGDELTIKQLAEEARAIGKRFYFFTMHPRISSNTYNPLNSGSALSKVDRVMTALKLDHDGDAGFYSNVQRSTFNPILKYLDIRGIKYTMRDVSELINNPKLVNELIGVEIDKDQVKGLTAAMEECIDLAQINQANSDIDLEQIMKNGDVCYFDLRSAIAPRLSSAIGRMIAMDLQSIGAYRTEKDKIAIIAIDEFQNMACEAFSNIISKVRSANYAMVLANQALGDLKNVSDGFLSTISTNTKTKIIFNIEEPDEIGVYSRKSGTIMVKVKSESKTASNYNDSLTGNGSRGENIQEIEIPRIHPNIFLKLPFGKSVIFHRGELAKLSNHTFLITGEQKTRLESEPWPDPEVPDLFFDEAATVDQLINQQKEELIESKSEVNLIPDLSKLDAAQQEDIEL